MYINIFKKKINSNHFGDKDNEENNDDSEVKNNDNIKNIFSSILTDYNKNKKDNNIDPKALDNFKRRIFDTYSKNSIEDKSKQMNNNNLSKIKSSLQNNNLKRAARKSEGNFTLKNKLNLLKGQLAHSKSINLDENKYEKKVTYKLKGHNLIKKNYTKNSIKSISKSPSNLSNFIHKSDNF